MHDAEDGVDAIAWLAAQDWCSGKVATFGGSYGGLVQWLTALHRPPALAAMIAMVSPSDPYVEWPTGTSIPVMVSWHRLTSGRVLQHVGDVDWETVYRHLPLVTMDEAGGFVSEHWRDTGEPLATSTRMQTATQTVHHDAARPSRLVLPVVPLDA